jgi:Dyp-type peroxidase family
MKDWIGDSKAMTELHNLLKQSNLLHADQLESSRQAQDIALLSLQNDLQGNILKSHGRNFSVQFFLKFNSGKINNAREWIKSFSKEFITSAAKQRTYRQNYLKQIIESLQSKSLELNKVNIYLERIQLEQEKKLKGIPLFANFFLSFKGYMSLLRCTDITLKNYFKDSPFINGMKFENGRISLFDPPLDKWEKEFTKEIHALILLADNDCDNLITQAREIESRVQDFSEIVHKEYGKVLRNKSGDAIEHFGFVDGISQPLFFKDDINKVKNQNVNEIWNPSAPLELVLIKDPLSPNEYGCGSYLVYRKLQQNVDLFNKKIIELAQKLNTAPSQAEAFVIGRFKDGTPVTLYNEAQSQTLIANNFNYQGDIHGTKCPFHAHIRNINPRGEVVTTGDRDQSKKRIARRGISYSYQKSKPSSWSTEEQLKYLQQVSIDTTDSEAGLLFMCFQASIAKQFVILQKTWANNIHFPKHFTGIDPVIGQSKQVDGGQDWPKGWGENHKERYDFSKCIQMKGGEYFFAPSISFLIDLPNRPANMS